MDKLRGYKNCAIQRCQNILCHSELISCFGLAPTHFLPLNGTNPFETIQILASQPPSSSSSSAGEANMNNNGRGQDPVNSGPRSRVGQISHSVVLGTFNVGEQGDGVVPDLGRVIGAVLNSIGIANQNGAQPGLQFNAQVQPPQRTGTEGTANEGNTPSQAGNQSQPGQPFSGQSLPQVVQIPLGAAIAIPSLNMPIPDSLNTLSEFMNHMELALSQHGNQSTQSPPVAVDPPTTDLPASSRGIPTPEALRIVLQQAQRLLGGSAVESLSVCTKAYCFILPFAAHTCFVLVAQSIPSQKLQVSR
ncbi:hypothetical protein M9H77_18898 [Catharanthus roseus]|uniref:Uncharacterized protein n=1 Tax=Catharanthus roseus TaxID=4058 RepID=A0ACC0B8R2_CATRO|nr:hypothetical protein M9H77_18898 [Catharanthus roseus]